MESLKYRRLISCRKKATISFILGSVALTARSCCSRRYQFYTSSAYSAVAAFSPSLPAVRYKKSRHLSRRGLSSSSSSSSSSFPDQEPVDEEQLAKWERMYGEGERSSIKQPVDDASKQEVMKMAETNSQIRVVTFDLDNTIWKTSRTIDAANDALAAFLDHNNIFQPKRVEKVMGELFKANKLRYCPIERDSAQAPVLLTALRKDAMKKILIESNDYGADDAEEMAEQAFQEWTRARHDAIPSNLASSVEACLQHISSIRTSDGHPVIIGAITDGNSDPSLIDGLSQYFEFCINAEQVGVSKPDKRVYLRAVSEIIGHPCLQDVVAAGGGDDDEPDKQAEDLLGPWWVHIGDDFVKDVVASKDLSMRSVWCRELVMDKLSSYKAQEKSSSSRSVEDLVKEVGEMKVVRMQVGAADYLHDSIQNEFADAIVDSFGNLGKLLHDWHDAALSDNAATASNAIVSGATETPQNTTTPLSEKNDALSSKFCLFCGTKLPSAALFCSSCGEKQTV